MNELSTAVSYLVLFASDTNIDAPESTTTSTADKECSLPSATISSSSPETTFWHEDRWTEEDVKLAQDNLTSSVNGYVDDQFRGSEEEDDDDDEDHDATPFSEEYVQRQRLRYNLHLSSNHDPAKNDNKYAQDAWNSFYQRHQVGFFRDRHYLPKEFPHEFHPSATLTNTTWIEMGCGVGNAILPFLEDASINMVQGWTIHAVDLSAVAIDLLQQDERWVQTLTSRQQYESNIITSTPTSTPNIPPPPPPPPRVFAHVCDVSCQPLRLQQESNTTTAVTPCADIMTLLFCLSAMAPDRMEYAIQNMTQYLKVGGILLFRDYGRYDQAQLQLAKQQQQQLPKLKPKRKGASRQAADTHATSDDSNNNRQLQPDTGVVESKDVVLDSASYTKQDGTSCYYFTVEEIQHLFERYGGCQVLQLHYLQRVYVNRATNEPRRRVWIQGRFVKKT